MKRNEVKLVAILVFTVIALIAALSGVILMVIASVQKFGWVALLAHKGFSTSLFAVTQLWDITIYKVGLIMNVIGSISLAFAKIYVGSMK